MSDTELSGRRKAAVLVLALGPEVAAKALSCMQPDAVTDLARAVAELERAPIAPEVVDTVLAEFHDMARRASAGVSANAGSLRRLLECSVGPDQRDELLDTLERERRYQSPFAEFCDLDAETLSEVLEGELTQVQALVLANVPPELATQVLSGRSQEEQVDLLSRMARLEDVPPELSLEVGAALGAAVRGRGPRPPRPSGEAGADNGRTRAVASILLSLDGQNEEEPGALLEKLKERDPETAAALEEQSFVFEDLTLLDAKALQQVLSQVEGRILAMALKGADEAVAQALLGNLSKRAREGVLEEKELLGPQPLSAVQEAQQSMVAVIRDLVQSGQVKIRRGKEAQLVS
ncbi:MAG: FliG C-terminal domain-containing protein [Planctomycetota bacterium]